MISDKRTFPTVNAAKKKKSTMNVRTAILYRKGLAALIDESVSGARLTSTNADTHHTRASRLFRRRSRRI